MAKKLIPLGKDAPQTVIEKIPENVIPQDTKDAPAPAGSSTKQKRNLQKTERVFHDLFRLDLANTKKDVGINPEKPIWEVIPHKHFYHTVNSDGKTLKTSAPTAGHYHEVIVESDADGNFTKVECGPPLVMHKGKSHPYKNDKHIHNVSYLVSEEVEKRVSSKDAVRVMEYFSQEENNARKGVAGIIKG